MARRPVGLISDTHGLVRREALDALAGVACIIHAGDVGAPAVLEALAAIAPVLAVRGNNDHGAWARRLPARRVIDAASSRILVVHDRRDAGEARHAGADVVVTGHSHRPSVEHVDGVLYVNPGSAGPRRFSLPVTVALLHPGRRATAVIVALPVGTTR